jgi:hypothetical protein
MQEREELRDLKREIKMSREGRVKRKICVWKEKKEKKREKEDWQERYEVVESSER